MTVAEFAGWYVAAFLMFATVVHWDMENDNLIPFFITGICAIVFFPLIIVGCLTLKIYEDWSGRK
jgi:purine-cytosine permease-like protein